MGANPKVLNEVNTIKKSKYGHEIRPAIAKGLELVSEDVERFKGRQENVETQFQRVIQGTTNKDVISAPEIIAARDGENFLVDRLLRDRLEIEEKTKHIYTSSRLGIAPGSNLSQNLLNAIADVPAGATIQFDQNEVYNITQEIVIKKDVFLDFNGSTINVNFSANQGSAIRFEGILKKELPLSANYSEGHQSIPIANTSNIEIGDIVLISSTELFNNSRINYRKGGAFSITNVASSNIRINRDMPFNMASSTTTAKIYKPIRGGIKNVRILNHGNLHAGVFGIRVENALNFKIENVFVDRFNHLILLRTHINTKVSHFFAGRSYYEGTQESYGLTSYMGTDFRMDQCIVRSGRHAVSITGFEPSFGTLITNSTFDNEDVNNQHSFDCHQSNYDLTMINCSANGAIFAGNCRIIGTRFNNAVSKAITISRYNHKEHANYTFTNCEFVGQSIRVGEGMMNPNGTATVIGSLVLENCVIKGGMSVQLNPAHVHKVLVIGTENVAFIVRATVEQFSIRNMRFLQDSNFVAQQDTGHVKNIVLKDSFVPARYRSIYLTNIDRAYISNTVFETVGSGSLTTILEMVGKELIMDQCTFPVGGAGVANMTQAAYINGGQNINLTGTNIKRATYA